MYTKYISRWNDIKILTHAGQSWGLPKMMWVGYKKEAKEVTVL